MAHPHGLRREHPREVARVAVGARPREHEAAAVGQRPEHLPHRDVERGRRLLEHALAGGEPERLLVPREPVAHGAVLDDDALGPPRRARRVDDVRRVARAHLRQRHLRRRAAALFVGGGIADGITEHAAPCVDGDDGAAVPRQRRGQPALGGAVGQPALGDAPRHDDGRRRGVGEHGGEPPRGVAGVEGEVGRPRLQRGEERHRQGQRPLERHGHDGAAPDAGRGEGPGEGAGAGVEGGVGERRPLEGDGDGVGRAGGLRREEGDERGVRVVAVGGPAGGAAGEIAEPHPLLRPEQRQHRHRLLGVRQRGSKQHLVMAEKVVDRLGIEEVRVVLPDETGPLGPILREQREVELRCPAEEVDGSRRDAAEGERGRGGILVHEHRLDERVAPEAPLRVEGLHEPLERGVLVGKGVERYVADVSEQGAERRPLPDPYPEDQRIDEEPDQSLNLRPVPARHRRPDREVVLARVPVEEGRVGRQQHHEHAAPLAPSKHLEAGFEVSRERTRPVLAPERLHGGAGIRRGEVEGGRERGEPVGPVGYVVPRYVRIEPEPLPGRVIGVLDRERREIGRRAGVERVVERAELPRQDAHRPPVEHDVVDGHEEHVLFIGDAEEARPQERASFEVEGTPRLLQARRVHGVGRELFDRELERRRRRDELDGLPVMRREGGAEGLVPGEEGLEAPP